MSEKKYKVLTDCLKNFNKVDILVGFNNNLTFESNIMTIKTGSISQNEWKILINNTLKLPKNVIENNPDWFKEVKEKKILEVILPQKANGVVVITNYSDNTVIVKSNSGNILDLKSNSTFVHRS